MMLRTIGAQIAVVLALVSAAAGWLKWHDVKVARKVEAEIVQRSEQEGAARANEADQAHTAARKRGAAERLRADPKTCPDCR